MAKLTKTEALLKFQDSLKDLMEATADEAKCRDILAEMLATLSLPANRQQIIDGNKQAISNLFIFVDGYAMQFMNLGKQT